MSAPLSPTPAPESAPPGQTKLQALLRHPAFREGARAQLQVALGIGAWGLVTGVAMVKSGLSVPMAVLMSLLVYAGSSQLAVLPLLALQSPLWVIWLTGLCVNLRFVIFSSMWRTPLGHWPPFKRLLMTYLATDMVFVLFFKRFEDPSPSPEHEPYLWGSVGVTWLAWQIPSMAGILLANFIPMHWGLGFAGILALLGVTLSMLVDRYTALAALVAGGVAIAAYGLPLRLNILVAIGAAVVLGLLFDHTQRIVRERQSAQTSAKTPTKTQ